MKKYRKAQPNITIKPETDLKLRPFLAYYNMSRSEFVSVMLEIAIKLGRDPRDLLSSSIDDVTISNRIMEAINHNGELLQQLIESQNSKDVGSDCFQTSQSTISETEGTLPDLEEQIETETSGTTSTLAQRITHESAMSDSKWLDHLRNHRCPQCGHKLIDVNYVGDSRVGCTGYRCKEYQCHYMLHTTIKELDCMTDDELLQFRRQTIKTDYNKPSILYPKTKM